MSSAEGSKTDTNLDFQPTTEHSPDGSEVEAKDSQTFAQDSTINQQKPKESEELIKDKIYTYAPITTEETFQQPKEWNLLLEKISNWWGNNDFKNQLKTLSQLVLIAFGFFVLVFTIQIYGNFLNGISQIPLAPELFKLTGIIWLSWFSTTKLLRSEDRKKLVSQMRRRFDSLLGDPDNKG